MFNSVRSYLREHHAPRVLAVLAAALVASVVPATAHAAEKGVVSEITWGDFEKVDIRIGTARGDGPSSSGRKPRPTSGVTCRTSKKLTLVVWRSAASTVGSRCRGRPAPRCL